MKVLVGVILLFTSLSQGNATKPKQFIPARAPNMSTMELLNWEQFRKLPVETKMKYFEEIRKFLVHEELKWPAGKKMASLSIENLKGLLSSEAFANDVSCPTYTNLSADVQKNIENDGSTCIKAGFLVCVTSTGFCSSSNPDYLKLSMGYCKDSSKLACSPPLFINADGSALCVEKAAATAAKSVTQACIKAQDALQLPPDTYKKLYSDGSKKFAAEYASLKDVLEHYCAADNGNQWKRDIQDCTALREQLKKIGGDAGADLAKAKDSDAAKICGGTAKVDGKDLSFQMLMIGDSNGRKFSMSAPGQTDWQPTECDKYGRPLNQDDPTIDHRFKDGNFKPCLFNKNGNQVQTLQLWSKSVNPDSCSFHLSKFQKGDLNKATIPQSCDVTFKSDNLLFRVDGSAKPVGALPVVGPPQEAQALNFIKNDGPAYYQLQGKEVVHDIFYTRDQNDLSKSDCWGRSYTVINTNTTNATAANGASEDLTPSADEHSTK